MPIHPIFENILAAHGMTAEGSAGGDKAVPATERAVGFTPGPWEFWPRKYAAAEIRNARGTAILAHVAQHGKFSVANAHLIAAAPELYEALEYATAMLEAYRTTSVGVHHEAIRKARAALRKARGE